MKFALLAALALLFAPNARATAELDALQIAAADHCPCKKAGQPMTNDTEAVPGEHYDVPAPTAAQLELEAAAERQFHASIESTLFGPNAATLTVQQKDVILQACLVGPFAPLRGQLAISATGDITREAYRHRRDSYLYRHSYTQSDLRAAYRALPVYQELERTRMANSYVPARSIPEVKLVSPCELSRRGKGVEEPETTIAGYHDEHTNTIYINACNSFRSSLATNVHEHSHAYTFDEARKGLHELYGSARGQMSAQFTMGLKGSMTQTCAFREAEELPAYMLARRADTEINSLYDVRADEQGWDGPHGAICVSDTAFMEWLSWMRGSGEAYAPAGASGESATALLKRQHDEVGATNYTAAQIRGFQHQARCPGK